MAIAEDTTSTHTSSTNVSSTSYSHTCTGSDLVLVSWVLFNDESTSTGNPTISAFTYNGVGLTHQATARNEYAGAARTYVSSCYVLPNPATGSNTVSVTLSETTSTGEPIYLVTTSLTGADTYTGTPPTATANSQTMSVTMTTSASTSWFLACGIIGRSTSNFTPDGTGVELAAIDDPTPNNSAYALYEVATGGSDTVSATTTDAGNRWAMAGCEITEATAAGGAVLFPQPRLYTVRSLLRR